MHIYSEVRQQRNKSILDLDRRQNQDKESHGDMKELQTDGQTDRRTDKRKAIEQNVNKGQGRAELEKYQRKCVRGTKKTSQVLSHGVFE